MLSNSEKLPQEKSKEEAFRLLPYDMALNCLARVSRSDHAALSVASKSYRSLVASSDLYKIRSLMGHTETYLYVCLRTPPDTNPRWFILRRRKTLDGSDLIPIPSLPSQAPEASSVVVLDWGIYVIGGFIRGKRTSDVFLLDCRTHTWRQVPSMRMARAYAAAGVVDGKIYVLGGCINVRHSHWGEVFDPKTQTWDCLPPMPKRKSGNKFIHSSFVRDQKVYAVDGTDKRFYYSPSEGKWGIRNRDQPRGNRRDWCMIDNMIYCISSVGVIFWCELHDEVIMDSKVVNGLLFPNWALICSRLVHFCEHLLHQWEQTNISHELEDLLPGARLSNYGDNIVLFWDVINSGRLEIWCAEIALDRSQEGEIRGNVLWSNAIMTVDPFLDHYNVLYSVSVTL